MGRTSRPTVAPFRKRDPGRAQRVGSSTSALTDMRRHLSHVHISENDRGTPGRGHIDFAAAVRALKGSGYDGWLTIEAFGRALPPAGRGDASLARFLPDADAGLSRRLQVHSQWLGQSLKARSPSRQVEQQSRSVTAEPCRMWRPATADFEGKTQRAESARGRWCQLRRTRPSPRPRPRRPPASSRPARFACRHSSRAS
jgi:Xylose isomerase-like TIM barrel